LIAQVGYFYRLTYYDLSWDAVEPLTYLYGIAIQMAVLSYFLLSGRDLSYEGLHAWVKGMYTRDAMKAQGIDKAALEDVLVALSKHRHRLDLVRKLRG